MRPPVQASKIPKVIRDGAQRRLLSFWRDQSGNYALIAALLMPVLVGFTGLGTDATLWMYKHRVMQSAADSGAFSAATAYVNNVGTSNSTLSDQAKAVAASYGFIDGENGVGVTVNAPYDSRPGSIQVVIQQSQTLLFSSLFLDNVTIGASAVAVDTPAVAGTGCVLALSQTASGAITAKGTSSVVLDHCSLASNSSNSSALTIGGSAQINALSVAVTGGISGSMSQILTPPGGITTGSAPTVDPYAGASMCAVGQTACPPSNCNQSDFTAQSAVTIGPAIQSPPPSVPPSYVFCGPTKLNSGAVVTLNPGIYYFEEDASGKSGGLTINGGATLQGDGVTLVFTSRSGTVFGSATINGGATINLSAPTTGPTAGIVFFGDRKMTTGNAFQFNGGATQTINGAIYVTKGAVSFAGGSTTSNACTQLVADTVTFTGNSSFKIGCTNGMQQIGSTPSSVRLVQ
jgi:Flp pilus assembly protein TadG